MGTASARHNDAGILTDRAPDGLAGPFGGRSVVGQDRRRGTVVEAPRVTETEHCPGSAR